MKYILPPFFVIFVDNLALGIPLALPQLSQSLFALSLYPLAQCISAPILGHLSDQFGRKKALIITLTGFILSLIGTALSLWTHHFVGLCLFQILSGLFAGNQVIALSALADVSLIASKRAKYFGVYGALVGDSWNLGVTLIPFLFLPFPKESFFLLAALALLSLLSVLFYFEETHPFPSRLKKGAATVKKALPLFLLLFFWSFSFITLIPWIEKGGTNWTLFILGAIWTSSSVFIYPFLRARFSSSALLGIGYGGTFLLMLILSFPKTNELIVVGALGLFAALAFIETLSSIAAKSGDGTYGKMLGISQSMQALGIFGGPLIASLLPVNWVFPLFALVLGIGVLVWLISRRGLAL